MSEVALNRSPLSRGAQWLLPAGVVGLMAVMVVPVPAMLLDLLISLSVSLSLMVLLTALSVRGPLSFSAYPSVLLLLTVFRLALNISSTRRILLHGSEGTAAAGNVIEAFGRFVVGGNLLVGGVMFLILVAIQFIVINHGASRISEVAARFTLDALPGKQMSIDADLNAGLIDENEARRRRTEVQDEADFYGAMDGAVRFTQRDAIASLVITAINILAGLAIGTMQAGMSVGEAVATYSVLTVGDGLVSAIPALLISVSGGIITTRKSVRKELGDEIGGQLFTDPRTLSVGSMCLGALALVPGMPTLAFLTLSGILGALAWAARGAIERARDQELEEASRESQAAPAEDSVEPLLAVDPLTIEVGYELVEIAGSEKAGGLLDRIRGIRRQLALDLGLVVPPVRVRDNLRLGSDEYVIQLRGATVGRGRLPRRKILAIDPGDIVERVDGEKTIDPAFGIEALWIAETDADLAGERGYTVVDRTSVLATHLSELIRRHAHELLTRQEVQKLLDAVAKSAPKLVEELVPERYSLGQVQKVLQALVRERVSIRDLQSVCEALLDLPPSADIQDAVASARRMLGRSLVEPLVEQGRLHVLTVGADLEHDVRQLLAPGPDGRPSPPDPRRTQSIVHRVAQGVRAVPAGTSPVILCGSPASRAVLRRLTESALPQVPLLAVTEIPEDVQVQAVGSIA